MPNLTTDKLLGKLGKLFLKVYKYIQSGIAAKGEKGVIVIVKFSQNAASSLKLMRKQAEKPTFSQLNKKFASLHVI